MPGLELAGPHTNALESLAVGLMDAGPSWRQRAAGLVLVQIRNLRIEKVTGVPQ